MMAAYYNEFDKKTAAWLRELIKQNLIAPGEVDERSITEVRPDDLRGFTQCHFFAGIGGWSHALRLAGWPDGLGVWTGSCPCQPFSNPGKRTGCADERHLWPDWFRIIQECQPATIFGEQVAGSVLHGWPDIVFTDLERLGYSCGAAILPSVSVGAFHVRQRLWWVATNPNCERGAGLEPGRDFGEIRQGWSHCSENLQQLCDHPFESGDCWPKPLLRSVDDGLSSRVGGCHGAGNAIVPQVGAEFIKAFCGLKQTT